jgi:hypothetical protein
MRLGPSTHSSPSNILQLSNDSYLKISTWNYVMSQSKHFSSYLTIFDTKYVPIKAFSSWHKKKIYEIKKEIMALIFEHLN